MVCQHEKQIFNSPFDMLVHSFDVSHSETFNKINTKSEASVKLDWVQDRFIGVTDNDSKKRIYHAARA